jgi:hypothetical protein
MARLFRRKGVGNHVAIFFFFFFVGGGWVGKSLV